MGSSVFRGYVEVDSLGETKSDKSWPKSGASFTTQSKKDFRPTFVDLKSQANLDSQ